MQNQVPESEQICVSSGSFEPQYIISNFINKQPVWLYVSIPVTFEISLQGVVLIDFRKRQFIINKKRHKCFKFGHILMALLSFLYVFLKLP